MCLYDNARSNTSITDWQLAAHGQTANNPDVDSKVNNVKSGKTDTNNQNASRKRRKCAVEADLDGERLDDETKPPVLYAWMNRCHSTTGRFLNKYSR